MNNITIDENYVETILDSFIYLCTQLTRNFRETKGIRRRIQLANKAVYSVLVILKEEYEASCLQINCKTCETWTLTQTSEKMLNAFERTVLRKIIRVKHGGHRG